jgi:predicted ATPase/class 3 adenylate cyclase
MFINNNLPSGTVTFLFTDIQGSTPLWEQVPAAMQVAIAQHHHILRQAIESNGGTVYQIIGDAFQAAFRLASQALNAALDAQRALITAKWPESTGPLVVRMGVHTGSAEIDPNDDAPYAVSHTLNRAARIMSAGHGGQILLSLEAASLVERELPEEVRLVDLGEHHLKGMAQREHLFQVDAPGLAKNFPLLTSGRELPHNLPVQLTSLIGREAEIAEIMQHLEDHRLVTLTGTGGTGKTRLSMRVAEEVLDQFPNGVWFVELAGLADPNLVPRTIIAALGLQESSRRSLLEQLQDYLQQKDLLLVLDNCEHMINECATISDILLRYCPKLKILASSREALGVAGEVVYPVPTLSVPGLNSQASVEEISHFTAVQLFEERARQTHPGFMITPANVSAVAQICRRLDGIPLAIELAAARAGVLGVEQIAERLDHRFRLLTGGARTALPRHQTLRASIDWSYSLLTDQERMLLLRLSVFYGGWTLQLAEEVCGFNELDEFDIIDGLGQLAKKSLIIVETEADGSARYRMLETIRQYANEKLMDSNESAAVRDRHLAAFDRVASLAKPHLRSHRQVEWLDRLEVEIDNLRAALAWAVEKDPVQGLRLVATLYWFWFIRGYRVEAEQWLHRLLDCLHYEDLNGQEKLIFAEAKARWLMLLRMSKGESTHTVQLAQDTLEMAEELGEAGKPIQLHVLQGLIWMWMAEDSSHIIDDESYIEKGLSLAHELGDRFMTAEFTMFRINNRDRIKARAYAEKHLALRRELGDLDGIMAANLFLGLHHLEFGQEADIPQTRMLLEEALELSQIVRNPLGMWSAECWLGALFCESGQLDVGIEKLQRALPISRDLGEALWEIWVLNALGHAAVLKQDWAAGLSYHKQAVDQSRIRHAVLSEMMSCINLAEVASMTGDIALAETQYQAAVAAVSHNEYAGHQEGLVAFSMGRIAMLKQEQTAASYFLEALEVFLHKEKSHGIAYCLDVLAVLFAAQSSQAGLAARLHGAADRARVKFSGWLWGYALPLFLIPLDLNQLLAPARSALGEAEYNRLYQEGIAMSTKQILEFSGRAKRWRMIHF